MLKKKKDLPKWVLDLCVIVGLCTGIALSLEDTGGSEIPRSHKSITGSFQLPHHIEQRPVYHLVSTAYNSLPDQTFGDPFITSTGERTRSGIIALSRDLLGEIPYGSVVEIVTIDHEEGVPWSCGFTMEDVREIETLPGLEPGQFRVADTLHIRKERQIDVWFEDLEEALTWGRCEVAIAPVELAVAH